MGVDVVDVIGCDTGVGQCVENGTGRTGSFGVRGGDVVRVGCDSASRDLGINLRSACFGVFLGLKDEYCCALAQDETVSVDVVGARCLGGLVVSRRQCVHRGKSGDGKRVDD